jgi:hypothetical protein
MSEAGRAASMFLSLELRHPTNIRVDRTALGKDLVDWLE